MSCGFIKRLAINGAVFTESVKAHACFTRTSSFVVIRRREAACVHPSRIIPVIIPQVVMVSRGPSALPDSQQDRDGLFIMNAGNDKASSGVLELPADVGEIAGEQKQTNREHSVCDTAVSAYKEVFSKGAMEGPGKTVSKVETHADKVGKFEGKGPNAGKTENSMGKTEGVGKSVGKLEGDTVGKFEGKGPNVGKTEGSRGKVEGVGKSVGKLEGDTVGKFEGKGPNVGKTEGSRGKVEGVGKSVGKSEGDTEGKGRYVGKSEGRTGKFEGVEKKVGKSEEDTVGKVEQMGKSVGKSEGKSIGKSEGTEGETVGKSVGKSENESVWKLGKVSETGKVASNVEGDVEKVTGRSVGKAEDDVGKASHKAVGKGEGDVGKTSQKSLGHEVGKSGGKIENQAVGKTSDTKEDFKEFVIAVSWKSEPEMNIVENLNAAGELKLPEGATLATYEQLVPTEDGFRVDIFMDQLMTRQFGRLLLYARQLPSTHTLLSQNCKTLPVGTLSVADVQFQGKGRAGNSWESPKGCLMFSFTLQMSDGRAVPFLQYVVSLAVIEGIESHCISKGLKVPEVRIKWPNDLFAKELKVGGVLCTSTYSSKMFNIVVGVGLNVGNRQPTTCLDALLEEINGEVPCLSKDELLAAIIGKFENLFEVFCSQGFFALESDYYKRWLHSGQTVVLEERQEGSSEVSHVPLKIQGLTPSGYLRAVDDASETYELHPDGNSFDFLKGLMRKKM